MKKAWEAVKRLLYPPKWLCVCLPVVSFAALGFIFASHREHRAEAYVVFLLSAYSLAIVIAALPQAVSRAKAWLLRLRPVQKLTSSALGMRYRNDRHFRASAGLLRGMAVNFLYMLFRLVTGIRYASAWFLSMAAYELVLCIMRADLARCNRKKAAADAAFVLRCYRRTALLLLLLNVPMGGMIVLMVRTDSGYSYPGYLIYLSALYTFYMMSLSIADMLRFRNCGSEILSAAKILRFVCAMMSILGLQTAMISRFSPDAPDYRREMNALTGGAVFFAVILTSVLMLCHAAKVRKKVCFSEQAKKQIL